MDSEYRLINDNDIKRITKKVKHNNHLIKKHKIKSYSIGDNLSNYEQQEKDVINGDYTSDYKSIQIQEAIKRIEKQLENISYSDDIYQYGEKYESKF